MMRIYVAAMFGLSLLLIATAGAAQISFVPGVARKVPSGPAFIAFDDFNNDGIQDVVVASTVRDTISVLFGSADGNFTGTVVEIPVGRWSHGVITGDFNGDHHSDIAVADRYSGGIFLIYGQSGSSFSSPQFFALPQPGPSVVAAGSFDDHPGADLFVVYGDCFAILREPALGPCYHALESTSSAPVIRSIIVADINGDALDDLLLLDRQSDGRDEVSVLLNHGNGDFSGSGPGFPTGHDAVAMTSGDFNNDGKLDLAVVTADSTNTIGIEILLGTENASFCARPPVTFGCPLRLNGIAVSCTPQDIVAADFDSDSHMDLAVSFSTRATETQQATPGFVNAYSGRGDGTFDFATQIIVGLGPRRMVAADVTGDAVPDVVVTAYTDSTVQVLRQKIGPKKWSGEPCVSGRQCFSGSCVDGICCDRQCLPTESCALPGWEGRCLYLGANDCTASGCPHGFSCGSAACAGDCDASGAVDITEVIHMVSLLLDDEPTADCQAGDPNRDDRITIDEVLLALTHAAEACPVAVCVRAPTPTPWATIAPPPTWTPLPCRVPE
ncbi:MAG: VCBS repeat-containing protein [Deltaproteobacteria bacterium]|nr:VCBS repeat-containing protein [Deltaproteobacteria bacterium]